MDLTIQIIFISGFVFVNGQSTESEPFPLPVDLETYLQPDDVDSGLYDDPGSLPENSCTRPCGNGSRFCYYRFTLEPYNVLGGACGDSPDNRTLFKRGCVTADGFVRGILTVNRRLPAPSIQVCAEDVLVIDVVNSMPGRSTSVHWHGLRQRDYKFMDGVPMVTQCPVVEGQTFRYTFRVDDPGLNFYHSHDGLQKVDGIVGSLVVRQPVGEDPNGDLYDFDLPSHTIVVQDWHHLTADELFPGIRSRFDDQKPHTYLIQGRGRVDSEDPEEETAFLGTPLTEFNVSQGFRYVFRIIAGTCFECQYEFTIENHDMVIIGADVRSIKPYRVDSITMSPGERFTVVVNCGKDVRSYWIQARTLGLCEDTGAHQLAVLRYKGGGQIPDSSPPTYDAPNPAGITMNPLNSECTEESRDRDGPCLHDLRSAREAPSRLLQEPNARLMWAFGFTGLDDQTLFNNTDYIRFLQSPSRRVASTINGIANMAPPSPVLSQFPDVPAGLICPQELYPEPGDIDSWNVNPRSCVHIQKVPADKVIEIVVVDLKAPNVSDMSHSIHLHGYDPFIAEMGKLEKDVSPEDAIAKLTEYLDSDRRRPMPVDMVSKDTFPLPSEGFVVLRIITDNTGYWFFHCHFAYHLDSGMSGILQVGEQDTFPPPPDGFPTCRNYLASTY